jgi:short-subunit dehydrogenase
MSVAIITGASSGLGKEFFSAIINRCPDVDEFWLIARRKEKLDAMSEMSGDKFAAAIPLDLSKQDSFDILTKILAEQKPKVSLLINNAGYGQLGEFQTETADSQTGMIDLNVRALTLMTHIVLPYMTDNSAIINVASIASFCPTPGMTVYSSTKAYVKSFSRGLRDELHETDSRKINVTAVCPGPMDTEFNSVAGIDNESSPAFVSLPKESPTDIAEKSLEAALHGKALYVGKYKWYHLLSKIFPSSFIMKYTRL